MLGGLGREREVRSGEALQGALRPSSETPIGTHRSSRPGRVMWQTQGQQGGQARIASGAPFSWDRFPAASFLSPFTSAPPWGPRSRESAAWVLSSAPHSNLPASLRTVPGAEAGPSCFRPPATGSRGRSVRGEPEGLGGGTGEQAAGSGEPERLDTGLGVLERESGEGWESRLLLEVDGGRRAGGLRDAAGGSQKMGVHTGAGAPLEVWGRACGEEPL